MSIDALAAGPRSAHWRGGWAQGLLYGTLGLPLAFVALPLYVVLPQYYAREFGIPLATLGGILLFTRLLDALADPFIGRWCDQLLGRSALQAWTAAALGAVALSIGFAALFFPPTAFQSAHVLWWCVASLSVTYISFSVVAVMHQSWGARLGGDKAQRTAIVAWREGAALIGVLLASALSLQAGMRVTTIIFALSLGLGILLLVRGPRPPARPILQLESSGTAPTTSGAGPLALPFQSAEFRRLLLIYLINGTASSIPATLVLFFISDRLLANQHEALFLTTYFAAAGLSVPMWLRCVKAWGLSRSWLMGMGMSVAVFVWAASLGAGDVTAFVVICALSGMALGADLTLPGALLAGVVQRAGHGAQAEGRYFGWWNFATKLNLALAAGLALPLLQWFGYTPGNRSDTALQALTWAYCLLPCGLKLMAAALLWRYWIRNLTPE